MALAPETVQDYPRPPRIEPAGAVLRVILGGEEIVHTAEALRVLETHHAPTYYLPRAAILADIAPAPGRSFCEWKGRARYWTLSAGGRTAPRCAWDYPDPAPGFAALKDHLAIYAHAMDACFVGSMEVTPQPGDFYGGWVTPNLRGLVKGGPGTEGW
ncbi:DUF427 domain-containing protein [Histidinibacterium lentulum]|uniref:DUF427 domain-containing protein n=1 Tax=Histidinibacterium lentulum TaxID=2480588 RepID=A0A3N2R811_9RHOB|nr:DUF427 domain-containing protein [Histidinibacterium lentulum]ROU03609.1 DUF427 domain-containing protein [Histidinibacterium lentulum]